MTVPIVNSETKEVLALNVSYPNVTGFKIINLIYKRKPFLIQYDVLRSRKIVHSELKVVNMTDKGFEDTIFDQNINGRV